MPGQHVSYGGATELHRPGTVGGEIPQERLGQREPVEAERRRLAVQTAPGVREAPSRQGTYGIQSDTFNPMVRPWPVRAQDQALEPQTCIHSACLSESF